MNEKNYRPQHSTAVSTKMMRRELHNGGRKSASVHRRKHGTAKRARGVSASRLSVLQMILKQLKYLINYGTF